MSEKSEWNEDEFIKKVNANLEVEGKWIIYTLVSSSEALFKGELQMQVNNLYREKSGEVEKQGRKFVDLLSTRYKLDIALAKLEGAMLIQSRRHGSATLYELTELGRKLSETKRK